MHHVHRQGRITSRDSAWGILLSHEIFRRDSPPGGCNRGTLSEAGPGRQFTGRGIGVKHGTSRHALPSRPTDPDVRRFLRSWCTISVSPKRKEEEPWPYSHDAFRICCTVCTCAPQRALRIRLPAPGSSLWTGSLPCSPATGSSHGQFCLKRQNTTDTALRPALAPSEAGVVAHPYPAVPHAGRPLGQPLPAERTPSSIRPALGTGGSVWRHPA